MRVPPPKEHVAFSIGDRVHVKPAHLANIIEKKNDDGELSCHENDMLEYPFFTVSEVKSNGSFRYKEYHHPGRECPWMIEQAFQQAETELFTDLTVQEKKEFINEVLGSLYKSGHIYHKIKQLIKNP